MKRLALVCLTLVGCAHAPQLVNVRLDEPRAQVTIPPGLFTPEVKTETPFVGRFEVTGLAPFGGHPLIFDIDDETARRFGGERATRIYGRLSVAHPHWPGPNQALDVTPSPDDLRALLSGQVEQITAWVVADKDSDHDHPGCCKKTNHRRVAALTLRTTPFPF
jgi:hypothetical protein